MNICFREGKSPSRKLIKRNNLMETTHRDIKSNYTNFCNHDCKPFALANKSESRVISSDLCVRPVSVITPSWRKNKMMELRCWRETPAPAVWARSHGRIRPSLMPEMCRHKLNPKPEWCFSCHPVLTSPSGQVQSYSQEQLYRESTESLREISVASYSWTGTVLVIQHQDFLRSWRVSEDPHLLAQRPA